MKMWQLPASVRRYEVEAAVHSGVFDVMSVQSALILVELLKLLLHIVSYWLATVHSRPQLLKSCGIRATTNSLSLPTSSYSNGCTRPHCPPPKKNCPSPGGMWDPI